MQRHFVTIQAQLQDGMELIVRARFRQQAKPLPQDASSPEALTYLFSDLFLRELANELRSKPPEQMAIATGCIENGVAAPSVSYRPRCEYARRTGIKADDDYKNALFSYLGDVGHQVLAVMHTHPGQGIEAITPSHTDLEAHGDHEAMGYPVIGGIFSQGEPCYVRFFTAGTPFRVVVNGNAKEVEPNVFELRDIQDPPL